MVKKCVYVSQYFVKLAFSLARLLQANLPSEKPRFPRLACVSTFFIHSPSVIARRATPDAAISLIATQKKIIKSYQNLVKTLDKVFLI